MVVESGGPGTGFIRDLKKDPRWARSRSLMLDVKSYQIDFRLYASWRTGLKRLIRLGVNTIHGNRSGKDNISLNAQAEISRWSVCAACDK